MQHVIVVGKNPVSTSNHRNMGRKSFLVGYPLVPQTDLVINLIFAPMNVLRIIFRGSKREKRMSPAPLRCDICGRFVSYGALEDGRAIHRMVFPESEYSFETFETICPRCMSIENKKKGKHHEGN